MRAPGSKRASVVAATVPVMPPPTIATSGGDAIAEVNGTKCENCKQTITLLCANSSVADLKLYSKVVHGGWMHKLGEGLGGSGCEGCRGRRRSCRRADHSRPDDLPF